MHLTLNNQQIEYEWHGNVAPTLVFLHEGLGCVAMWRDFPQKLATATGWSALVYSRFGYGESSPIVLPRSADYHTPEAVDVLPKLLAALDIHDHILIGHSDGGTIALLNAGLAAGAGLRGVITEAAHVFNEEKSREGIRAAYEPYTSGKLRKRLVKYHGDNVDGAFWGWHDVWLSAEFHDWNIEYCLPTITVPTLVMQGADDHYGTLAQVDAIVNGIGDDLAQPLILPDCGHTPHREQMEMTLTAMCRFVERIGSIT